MPVGRKTTVFFVEFRPQKRKWLVVAPKWEHPQIVLGFRFRHRVQQESSVAGPASGVRGIARLQQKRLSRRAACGLLIDPGIAVVARTEGDAAAVRGPDRMPSRGRTEREALARASREIEQPESYWLVQGGTAVDSGAHSVG